MQLVLINLLYLLKTKIKIMKDKVTYLHEFENGIIEVSRGVVTKYDWYVTVKLSPIECDGYTEKRLIYLDQNIFLTRKQALKTTKQLLAKYKLI